MARSRILPACFQQPCFVGVIQNERPEAAVYYKRLEVGLYRSFRKRYANPDKKTYSVAHAELAILGINPTTHCILLIPKLLACHKHISKEGSLARVL